MGNGSFLRLNGAQGRDRTTDTAIFSRMLYQLSYLGTAALRRERACISLFAGDQVTFRHFFQLFHHFQSGQVLPECDSCQKTSGPDPHLRSVLNKKGGILPVQVYRIRGI